VRQPSAADHGRAAAQKRRVHAKLATRRRSREAVMSLGDLRDSLDLEFVSIAPAGQLGRPFDSAVAYRADRHRFNGYYYIKSYTF